MLECLLDPYHINNQEDSADFWAMLAAKKNHHRSHKSETPAGKQYGKSLTTNRRSLF